jgi:hypothetical protein
MNEDGTNLAETTEPIKALFTELNIHLSELSRRVRNGSITKESAICVRLNREVALVVYVSPDRKNSPYLYCHNMKTCELSEEIMYDDIMRLNDPSAWEYLKLRCGRINELKMDMYFAPGEIDEMRKTSAHYDNVADQYCKTQPAKMDIDRAWQIELDAIAEDDWPEEDFEDYDYDDYEDYDEDEPSRDDDGIGLGD